jgi:ferredoxin
MRILIDLNRCQSYGQCCFAAPTVFRIHNGESLEYDYAPDDALREQVVNAVKACPVQAIVLGLDDPAYEALQDGERHGQ